MRPRISAGSKAPISRGPHPPFLGRSRLRLSGLHLAPVNLGHAPSIADESVRRPLRISLHYVNFHTSTYTSGFPWIPTPTVAASRSTPDTTPAPGDSSAPRTSHKRVGRPSSDDGGVFLFASLGRRDAPQARAPANKRTGPSLSGVPRAALHHVGRSSLLCSTRNQLSSTYQWIPVDPYAPSRDRHLSDRDHERKTYTLWHAV